MLVAFALKAVRISSAIVLSALLAACLEDSGAESQIGAPNCEDPTIACGGVCIDPSADPANCGACGNACDASELCSAGECVDGCDASLTACGQSCRDLTSDAAHCGACDSPCASGFLCVAGVCANGDGEPAPTDRRIRVAGNEFNVCGRSIFMNGANTPWHHWNDFGGDYDEGWWSEHYAAMHESGMNSSRVWITCNGTVGIEIADDGTVLGATPSHWEHLDSFFAIAEENQIYVMATLMSFDHFEDGAAARWRAWLASDEAIDSYVDNYLLPFLERYGENPYLWSIDLINEPDWVHERLGISFDRLRAYFARAARAIHENSEVLVTVGMGGPKYSAPCAGCEPSVNDYQLREALDDPAVFLDFTSPHYYDWIGDTWVNMLHETPGTLDFPIDRPGVIGEFPARGTEGHTLSQDIEAAFSNGWRGTMPWTSNGVDRNGGFAEVSVAASAFRDARPGLVLPSCP